MSGHSKWATIRRKKEKLDSARGKAFSKLIKEITIATRMGGGDEAANPRLRVAITAAKAANMPANNIERAIKKGTGELPGVTYEEVTYEAYGPGGIALLIEILTDNKNRCVSEIRHMVSKHGGNMAEAGAVNWMFNRVGLILIQAADTDEDTLIMEALEAGAEDVKHDGDFFSVTTKPENLEDVKAKLEETDFKIESAEAGMIPQTYVPVEGNQVKQVLRLMETLDDHDDVQKVWSNFDIDDDLIEDE